MLRVDSRLTVRKICTRHLACRVSYHVGGTFIAVSRTTFAAPCLPCLAPRSRHLACCQVTLFRIGAVRLCVTSVAFFPRYICFGRFICFICAFRALYVLYKVNHTLYIHCIQNGATSNTVFEMCFDIGSQHFGCWGQNKSRIQHNEVHPTSYYYSFFFVQARWWTTPAGAGAACLGDRRVAHALT